MNKDNEKIKGILFLIWFISSIFLLFIIPNIYLKLVLFGQYFFVFGLIAVLNTDFSRQDYLLILFLLVGLILIQIGLVGLIVNEFLSKMIFVAIINSIILSGVLILIFERQYKTKQEKNKILSFKSNRKGKIKLYQRSYIYNIRDLSLLKEKNQYKVSLITKTEYKLCKKETIHYIYNTIAVTIIVIGLIIKFLGLFFLNI